MSETTEIVERVARAIACARWNVPTEPVEAEELRQFVEDHWRHYEPKARAALAAMREPTQAMTDIGWEHIPHRYCSGEDVGNAWQAMIDAALRDV